MSAAKRPLDSGEGGAFLAWTAEHWPRAHGYWPAQAVGAAAIGAAAIGGPPVVDVSVAMSYYPLHDGAGWDASRLAGLGVRPALGTHRPPGEPDGKWVAACTERYERFLELSRHPCPVGVTPV